MFSRKSKIYVWLKSMLYPGLDLHTRCRYKYLPNYFLSGEIHTLDAGCGNGCLGYAAYKLGNKVLGITFDQDQVERNNVFFDSKNVNKERLEFKVCNLYDVKDLNRKFDQIICSETLEHISNDNLIVKHFYNILNPSGVLHLCCPYSLHPLNNLGRTNAPEDGGHVRDGYTIETYKKLLELIGFEIVESIGLGSPFLVNLDNFIRLITNNLSELVALPFFLLTWPLQLLDYPNPEVPLSLYVKALKKF